MRDGPEAGHPIDHPHVGTRQPLRVGVLLGAGCQPRWIENALKRILKSPVIHVAAIIGPGSSIKKGPNANRSQRPSHLLRCLLAADRRMFTRQPDPLDTACLASVGGAIPRVELPQPSLTLGFRESIRALDLDVIVCLGSVETGRQLTTSVRRGVWYFPEMAEAIARRLPMGFEATVRAEAVAETSLVEITDGKTPGQILARAVSAVNAYSPNVTASRLLWAQAAMPVRALERDWQRLQNHEQPMGIEATCSDLRERRDIQSDASGAVGVAARIGLRLMKHAFRSVLYRSEWALAVRRDGEITVETLSRPSSGGSYTAIENPRDGFWADPFPVTDGDRTWLFVEEFPHGSDRAHIAVMELFQDGTVGPSTVVLAHSYHLSYPFVFRWQGEWYMIPETRDNKTVDLYRSNCFPFDWVLERRLLHDVEALDSTVVEIGGRWWLFAAIATTGGSENDELHIFEASSPLGPWAPHPLNPQLSDVRRARPAGRIFAVDGAWYRPAQDCSRRYGYATVFLRITVLSSDRYAEEVVGRIDPTWANGLLGTHIFNHANGLSVVDGARWRRRWFGASR